MKKIILSLSLVLFVFGIAKAQTSLESWTGIYEGEESGMNATETRSYSSWAKLEFTCEEDCIGVYTDGENSDTYNKFNLTAKGSANEISFFYGACMPKEEGSSEPCTDDYKKGDFMFKLTKSKNSKGKVVILTTWGKLNKGESGKVYFKKGEAE